MTSDNNHGKERERLQESNILPGAASSFSGTAAAAGGSLSAGRLGRGGGGTAALCIPCESHRTNGARAPVWYLSSSPTPNRDQNLIVAVIRSQIKNQIL